MICMPSNESLGHNPCGRVFVSAVGHAIHSQEIEVRFGREVTDDNTLCVVGGNIDGTAAKIGIGIRKARTMNTAILGCCYGT